MGEPHLSADDVADAASGLSRFGARVLGKSWLARLATMGSLSRRGAFRAFVASREGKRLFGTSELFQRISRTALIEDLWRAGLLNAFTDPSRARRFYSVAKRLQRPRTGRLLLEVEGAWVEKPTNITLGGGISLKRYSAAEWSEAQPLLAEERVDPEVGTNVVWLEGDASDGIIFVEGYGVRTPRPDPLERALPGLLSLSLFGAGFFKLGARFHLVPGWSLSRRSEPRGQLDPQGGWISDITPKWKLHERFVADLAHFATLFYSRWQAAMSADENGRLAIAGKSFVAATERLLDRPRRAEKEMAALELVRIFDGVLNPGDDPKNSGSTERMKHVVPFVLRSASGWFTDAIDVATFLKTSRSWVYMRSEREEIPFLRIGGLLRFQPSKIREWAASGAVAVRRIR